MAFPDDRLPIRLELAFGADPAGDQAEWEWTDVTTSIHAQSIGISRGRAAEAAQVQPTSASVTLDNPDGRYTPDHPMSPYWPYIDQGVPGRLSVQHGASWLALNGDPNGHASTPDTPALDITGDLDLRVEATADWHTAGLEETLIGKWGPNDGTWSYVLRLSNTTIVLGWTTDGTESTFTGITSGALPTQVPHRAAVRATLDVDNGTGGYTVVLYWAESLDGPWEEVYTHHGTGVTSVYSSAEPLTLTPSYTSVSGAVRSTLTGRIHRAEVRDGIGGTIVASPDFRNLDPGTTGVTDSAGLPWTVTAPAEVTNWHPRITGQTDSWEPDWPYGDLSSATDDGESRVSVTVSGLLRRLSQGQKELESTLRRRIPSFSPVAYWPLEEDRDATQAYSPTPGVQPMQVSGDIEFAADDTLPGSRALPRLGTGASLTAAVPAAAAGSWHVEMVMHADTAPDAPAQVMAVYTSGGTYARYEIHAGMFDPTTPQLLVYGYDTDDNRTTLINAASTIFGAWIRLQLFAETSGGTTTLQVRHISIGESSLTYAASWSGDAGHATRVSIAVTEPLDGLRVGHLGVFTDPDTLAYNLADHGFDGEAAATRIARLCDEEGILVRVVGRPFDTAAMGPQRPGKLLELLRECAAVDGGILGEQRERIGLRYRTRTSLYNQRPVLELDAGASEITNPFRPVKDDSGTRNDVQVSRRGGSTARVVDEESVARRGRYEEQLTLNPASDGQLPDIAAWRVHLGTWPGMRYPSVSAELAIAPQVIEDWLRLDSGDLVQVTGLPPQHPAGAVTLMAEGYTEMLSPTRWTVRANCSPAGPWTVGVVGDDVLGRADTAGSVLADPAGEADTALYVTTTQGPQWTTDPAEFPFDLRVGGEVVTATACTEPEEAPMRAAADSDTVAATSAVAPSVDATGAGLLVCAWVPWDGTEAWTVPGTMTVRAQTTGVWSVLADATEILAAAGATGTRAATRSVSAPWAAVSVVASGAPVVEEHLDGLATDPLNGHDPGPVELTTAVSTEAGWWLLALHGYDNDAAAPGPSGSGWAVLATTGSNGGSTATVGAWAKRAAGGAETVVFPEGDADDNHARLYVISGATDLTVQAMTVTRSVNSITKSHARGADIRLAQPAIVSH
ncbi:hypothetical protein ACGRHY_14435 [Streptomyces sp. HK10]|uniref:hypothetical protein n=1 Tax=Streptomyces sp. HK10 TaxID=3373255 RepID=UPI0037488A69